MTEIGADWQVVEGAATAWFDAPSLVEGAALAGRIVELSSEAVVDLRATGVRVRLDSGSGSHAGAVSAAARDLGLTANPAVIQQLSVVFESGNPAAVRPFWQRALGYAPSDDGGLADPLRRDPAIRFRQSSEPQPSRNRFHLDVVRPAAVADQTDLGEASGPYGVCHTDPDGNEVDLVPGATLGEQTTTADWQTVFSAMACYRVTSPAQQRDLATTAAALAADAGFPLLIDLRPSLVILDSAKDQWHPEAHGQPLDFTALAQALQTTARSLAATPDPHLPRFTQLVLAAADVPTLRTFWTTALAYTPDRRPHVTDLHDPHRLNPVLVLQQLTPPHPPHPHPHNRIHLALTLPTTQAQSRLTATLAAGARLLSTSPTHHHLADPENNHLLILPTP